MDIGKSIERKGLADVLAGAEFAIENGQTKYYSLWQGRVLKMAYDGEDIANEGMDDLRGMLEAATRGGTKATYTLRFHKRLGKGDTIDNNTPYSSSFNFRLNDDSTLYNPIAGVNAGMTPEFYTMFKALSDKIDSISGGAEVEAEETQFEKIARIVESPAAEKAMDMIAGFLMKGRRMANNHFSNNSGGLSGIAGIDANASQAEKIKAAIEILAQKDPNLGDHLLLLAELANESMRLYNKGINELKKALEP